MASIGRAESGGVARRTISRTGLIVGAAFFLAAATPAPSQHGAERRCSVEETAECVAPEKEPAKSFWEHTTTDPVAAYTGVLALLTIVLAATSVIQISYLGKADKLAASNAKLAERALVDVQKAALSFVKFQVDPSREGTPQRIKEIFVSAIWRNAGPTRAMKVMFSIEIMYVLKQARADVDPTFVPKLNALKLDMESLEVRHTPRLSVSRDYLQRLINGEAKAFAVTRCRYDDVFKDAFRTPEIQATHIAEMVLPGSLVLLENGAAIEWKPVAEMTNP